MRHIVEALVAWLPLDVRSRRAVDETLLDWALEVEECSSTAGRAFVSARSALSVARALAGAAVRESSAVPFAWVARRILLFGALPAMVFVVVTSPLLPPLLKHLPLGLRLEVVWALWTESLVVLPLALFYCVAWRPSARVLPAFGMPLTSAGLVIVCLMLVLPLADWRIRELGYFAFGWPAPLASHVRFDVPRAVLVASIACTAWALTILADEVFRATRRRVITLVLTPIVYSGAIFGSLFVGSTVAAVLYQRGLVSWLLLLGAIVPIGCAIVVVASLSWRGRLQADRLGRT